MEEEEKKMDVMAESLVLGKIENIELDSLAYLKIISSCHPDPSNASASASGQLVGLEHEGCLQVSNCFLIPSDTTDSLNYAVTMLRCFQGVNIDHEAVGWFCSSLVVGSLFSDQIIETQFNFQQNIAQSVMIIYDPIQSTGGNISLTAYRLSDKFMALYKEKKFTAESLSRAQVTLRDIYIEIPISVKTTHYAKMMLQLFEKETVFPVFESLNLTSSLVLEKNTEGICDSMDAYAQEQYKYNRYHQQMTRQQQIINHHTNKRKFENQKRIAAGEEPLPDEDIAAQFRTIHEPSRYEGLLLQAQMNHYSNLIAEAVNVRSEKLSICKQIHPR